MNSRSAQAGFAKSAALLLAGLAVVCLGQAQEPEPSPGKDHPLLAMDLHKVGYDTSQSTMRLSKFVLGGRNTARHRRWRNLTVYRLPAIKSA
jgi:hypothetical protein